MVKINKKEEPLLIGRYECGPISGCHVKVNIYEHDIYLHSYSKGPYWDYCFIAFDCPCCKKTVYIPINDYSGDPMKLPLKEMRMPKSSRCTIL